MCSLRLLAIACSRKASDRLLRGSESGHAYVRLGSEAADRYGDQGAAERSADVIGVRSALVLVVGEVQIISLDHFREEG
jgi:hypothetical protein